MLKLKLRPIGNSVGVILPVELLSRLRVAAGDELFVNESTSGVELSAYDPNFESSMKAFEVVRKKYRNEGDELVANIYDRFVSAAAYSKANLIELTGASGSKTKVIPPAKITTTNTTEVVTIDDAPPVIPEKKQANKKKEIIPELSEADKALQDAV